MTLPSSPETLSYEQFVRALCKSGDHILAELTGDDCHRLHMAVGIAGEGGELLDALKAATIYRKPLDRANVIEELGDLEFFMEGLRSSLGITREETLTGNRAKLNKRYSGTYSNQAAQDRADKVHLEPPNIEGRCSKCSAIFAMNCSICSIPDCPNK